ncbi:MAG: GNAT family N-acetyltransferase [Lachnospiraceae bacterium]|nr:GNAT family N-acetyltransferase [Lachnospiraceae bacterium]
MKTIIITGEYLPKIPDGWLSELKKTYGVEVCEKVRKKEIQQFLQERKLVPEKTLLIGNNPFTLKEAKEIPMAVLPVEEDGFEYYGFDITTTEPWEAEDVFLPRVYQRFWDLPWLITETKRMIIREEQESDLDAIYAMYEQPHIQQFLDPPFEDRGEELEYMRKYRKYVYGFYGYGLWHLIDKATGEHVGRAGISPKVYEDGVRGAELGYMIAEPFTGRGYCMEACRGILMYALEQLDIRLVYLLVKPDNVVSIHIAEKLGFEFDKEITDQNRQMLRFYKGF